MGQDFVQQNRYPYQLPKKQLKKVKNKNGKSNPNDPNLTWGQWWNQPNQLNNDKGTKTWVSKERTLISRQTFLVVFMGSKDVVHIIVYSTWD